MSILFSKLITTVTYASIIPIVLALIRFITLLRSSKIEKLFFSQEKNLFIQFSNILLISIPISIVGGWLLKVMVPLEDNQLTSAEIFLVYYLVSFIASFILVFQFYMTIFSDYLGRYSYYIEHKEHGPMFLIKSTKKDEVLLYQKKRLDFTEGENGIIYMKIEELKKDYMIFQEVEISSIEKFAEWVMSKKKKDI